MKKNNNIQRIHFGSMYSYSETTDFLKDKRVILMLNVLKKISKKQSSPKILDVGVGDGYMYKNLVSSFNIYGVDISNPLVEKAKKNGIHAFVCDVEQEGLPFADNEFDVVITGETIEHITNSDYFLSELNRVTKKDGSLILTYPNINTPLSLLMMALFDLPPMYAARFRSPHVRDWTKRLIKFALKEFGYKTNEILGASFYIPKIGMFDLLGVAKYFPRFSNQVVISARKIKEVKYIAAKVVQVDLQHN